MPDAQYETWVAEEREHLLSLFLESADRLTELYLKLGKYAEVIKLSQRILSKDACWERAYRHLMLAYYHLGDRGQVGRVFQRCNQSLQEELDVSPAPETYALYEKLTG
jgi:DNA-binding SARP family transcriptional activator